MEPLLATCGSTRLLLEVSVIAIQDYKPMSDSSGHGKVISTLEMIGKLQKFQLIDGKSRLFCFCVFLDDLQPHPTFASMASAFG